MSEIVVLGTSCVQIVLVLGFGFVASYACARLSPVLTYGMLLPGRTASRLYTLARARAAASTGTTKSDLCSSNPLYQ
eukprot:3731507-Rhodomonas_salina.5